MKHSLIHDRTYTNCNDKKADVFGTKRDTPKRDRISTFIYYHHQLTATATATMPTPPLSFAIHDPEI